MEKIVEVEDLLSGYEIYWVKKKKTEYIDKNTFRRKYDIDELYHDIENSIVVEVYELPLPEDLETIQNGITNEGIVKKFERFVNENLSNQNRFFNVSDSELKAIINTTDQAQDWASDQSYKHEQKYKQSKNYIDELVQYKHLIEQNNMLCIYDLAKFELAIRNNEKGIRGYTNDKIYDKLIESRIRYKQDYEKLKDFQNKYKKLKK